VHQTCQWWNFLLLRTSVLFRAICWI